MKKFRVESFNFHTNNEMKKNILIPKSVFEETQCEESKKNMTDMDKHNNTNEHMKNVS